VAAEKRPPQPTLAAPPPPEQAPAPEPKGFFAKMKAFFGVK